MLERIKKLIEKQNLTATQFAAEVGVQRSAVSHLLSGRNKPSLDFMLKIKKRFKEISLDWLLLGDGKMIEKAPKQEMEAENVEESLFQSWEEKIKTDKTGSETKLKEQEIPFDLAKSEDPPVYTKKNSEEKELSPQKLILLYPDNTFKIFKAP